MSAALALVAALLLGAPAPAAAHAPAWGSWRHHHVSCQRLAYHGISIVTGKPIHGVKIVCTR